jgi:membrane protein YdbS with pleckstrin-like domain
MINLGETNRLPSKVIWYQVSSVMLIIFLISILISYYFWQIFITLTIIIALPVLVPLFIKYKFFSFVVEKDKITTKSGMLSRESKAIPFDRVQTVDGHQGLWMRLFGLSKVKIWTASPQQINIGTRNSNSEAEIKMILTLEDADWIKEFIFKK